MLILPRWLSDNARISGLLLHHFEHVEVLSVGSDLFSRVNPHGLALPRVYGYTTKWPVDVFCSKQYNRFSSESSLSALDFDLTEPDKFVAASTSDSN